MTDTTLAEHFAGTEAVKASASIGLQWGLVSIPLSIYASDDDGIKVKRSEFTYDDHPVGRAPIDRITGELVEADQIVRKAPSSTGELVEVTDEEMAQASIGGATPGEIIAFIPLASIGGIYRIEDEKQARPSRITVGKKKVDDPNAAKAFALLCTVMAEAQVAALFLISLRGPARYAALTPDGRMLRLKFAEEQRPARELPAVECTEAELNMGRQLLATVGTATPVLNDTTSAKVQAFVDAKATGEVAAIIELVPVPAVVDLLGALADSLSAAKAAGVTPEAPSSSWPRQEVA